jgi:hypothetical protein
MDSLRFDMKREFLPTLVILTYNQISGFFFFFFFFFFFEIVGFCCVTTRKVDFFHPTISHHGDRIQVSLHFDEESELLSSQPWYYFLAFLGWNIAFVAFRPGK